MISNFDPSLDLYLLLSSTSSSPHQKFDDVFLKSYRYRSWYNLLVCPLLLFCNVIAYTDDTFFQNRCVGVWQNDRVEIIANDQGNRTTPSYVSFSDNERLIGDAAKNQVAMNPHNT